MNPIILPTKRQRLLLDYIEAFIKENGYSPSYREIMAGLKYTSVATVALHINNLIKRGWLRKREHSARSLEVVNPSLSSTDKLPDEQVAVAAWMESLGFVRHIRPLGREKGWIQHEAGRLFVENSIANYFYQATKHHCTNMVGPTTLVEGSALVMPDLPKQLSWIHSDGQEIYDRFVEELKKQPETGGHSPQYATPNILDAARKAAGIDNPIA